MKLWQVWKIYTEEALDRCRMDNFPDGGHYSELVPGGR